MTRRRLGRLLAAMLALPTITHVSGAAFGATGGGPVTPIDPQRVIDTRDTARVAAGSHIEVDVTGQHGVPDDATAVFLNVTAVNPDAAGYLTVWPCGDRPATSNVNYAAGRIAAGAVLAGTSATGDVCVYSKSTVDVIVDIAGFVPAGGAVRPLTPTRAIDTRTADRVPAGGEVELVVRGRFGLPSDAAAVFLNVTAANPDAAGYLTVWPCGELPVLSNRQAVSSVNYLAGQTVANAAFAKITADGRVCVYSKAATDVVVDVAGYVPAGEDAFAVTPQRLQDTRRNHRVAAGGQILVGVGVSDVPPDATAVFLNVTAVNPDAAGYLTVWPCGERPVVSNVNYEAGQTVANAVFTKVGAGQHVCVYSKAATDVIVDRAGYIAPGPSGYLGGVLDTLTIAEPDPGRPAFVSDEWFGEGWADIDGDCRNTRDELLELRSEEPAVFSGCTVISGRWTDPYDAAVYTQAADVQVDHLVTLAEAHRSGGWRWDQATRRGFTNDMTDDHLVVVGVSVSESKGDLTPDDWMPPSGGANCWHALSWVQVKVRYRLTITVPEHLALRAALRGCPPGTVYGDLTPAPITYTTDPTPAP